MPQPHSNGDHLTPTSRLWPDPDTGPWLLTFHWQVIAGRAECVGLDIASALPAETIRQRYADLATLPDIGQPIRTTTLRDLKLSELLHEERVHAAHLAVTVLDDAETARTYQTPNMRPATRRRLELVAQVYRAAHAAGERPVRAVADRLKISPGAASNLVLRARAVGLLPPAEAGKPQG